MTITQFLSLHWRAISEALVTVATAAINAMAVPSPANSPQYVYWYDFLHSLPLPTISSHQMKITQVLAAPMPAPAAAPVTAQNTATFKVTTTTPDPISTPPPVTVGSGPSPGAGAGIGQ